jgi:hypothetical protein
MLTIIADSLLLATRTGLPRSRPLPPRHDDNAGQTEPWAGPPRWEALRHWLR